MDNEPREDRLDLRDTTSGSLGKIQRQHKGSEGALVLHST